ncbi:MAG: hypothetical protein AB7T63_05990 [Planctomycetota bacterium]
MTRRRLLIASSLVAVALFGLATCGGWRFVKTNDFGGQEDLVLVEGLKSDIWLSPAESYVGLPPLISFTTRGAPFSVRLQVWDRQSRYRTLHVDVVEVIYADGETIRRAIIWSAPFRDWAGGLCVTSEVPDVVTRHVEHRLTITGRLEELGGAMISFQASVPFRPAHRTWGGPNLFYLDA